MTLNEIINELQSIDCSGNADYNLFVKIGGKKINLQKGCLKHIAKNYEKIIIKQN